MASLPVEIKFAQNLAGNEKKVRDKAVKKLRKYLKAKSSSKKDGFTMEDFLKIWKGLHYCMWMQDKPLLQEELSTTLSQLVHDLSTIDAQLMFVKVFFITISREWNSIDVWRLDKFLMLVRNMVNESLVVIKKLKWDSVHLYQLIQVFYDNVMNPDMDNIPDGLRIHFTDIYLDEVEKVADKKLTGRHLLTCLVPFIKFLQIAKNHVLKRVLSGVFDPIIKCAAEKERIKQGKQGSKEDEEEVPYMSLKFEFPLISDHIFDVSQQDCVLARNRPMLYGIVKKLQDVEKGVLPQSKEIVIPEGVTKKDVHLAVNKLISFESIKKKNRKKNRKKNKKNKNDGNNNNNERNENHDPNVTSVSSSVPLEEPSTSAAAVGAKRKHSLTEDSGLESMTKIKKRKQSADLETGKDKNKKKNAKALTTAGQGPNTTATNNNTESLTATGEAAYTVTVERVEQNNEKVDNAVKASTSKKSQVVQIEAEVPSSLSKKSEISVEKVLKSGKRRRSESDVTALKSMSEKLQPTNTTPEIVVNAPSVNASNSSGNAEEGEIEIWIPNKKYKGKKEANRRSSFAAFDHSGPPSALVRRAHSKLKQTPSTMKKATAARSASKNSKRVSFDLKKNQAQAFKDSLKTPATPFNPTVKPDQGILKTPSPNMTNSSQNVTSNTSKDPQTPVTRQSKRRAMSANRATTKTSVVSVGFQGVKMTRMKAADFFL